MMEGQAEETLSSVSEEQSTKSSQDAMRTRVRLFAEAVVKMVSPVLLALALRKVDLSSEKSWLRASISPIAAFTMAFSVLLMALLWICLSKIVPRLERLQYAAFKLLVFLCAMLLMSLASVILVLISMKYKLSVIFAVVPALFITGLCFWSLRCDGTHDAALHAMVNWDQELENSVDFSAAFTVLLFLGLERLALEVQQGSRECEGSQHHHLESTLVLSFVTCVLGIAVMFVWTIAPLTRPEEEEMLVPMPLCIEASNWTLALFVTGIVLWITWVPLEEYALFVIVPPFMTLFGWMFVNFNSEGDEDQSLEDKGSTPTLDDDYVVDFEGQVPLELADKQNDQEGVQPSQHDGNLPWIDNTVDAYEQDEVKPPPLELTKFAFAGFLAVSIPSINECSVTVWTHAFILLTAMSVVSALVWRLLAHRADQSPAEIAAANIASSVAHISAMIALVPFGVMAGVNALAVSTCLDATGPQG